MPLDVLFESDGVVEPRLSRGENERDPAGPDALEDGLQGFPPATEFLEVPALELRPFVPVVVEPAPKFGGGRSLLGPKVDLGVLLRETAGPQPVDENAAAIRSRRGFVGTFQ